MVFGSVQSVARNLDAFQGEFSLLIVDECHRIGDDEESQYQQNPHSPDKSESPLTPAGADCHAFSIGQRLDLTSFIITAWYAAMRKPFSVTAFMSCRCVI
ncbi:hypothetical protein ACP0HM_10900 [Escherichia coli]